MYVFVENWVVKGGVCEQHVVSVTPSTSKILNIFSSYEYLPHEAKGFFFTTMMVLSGLSRTYVMCSTLQF